MTLSAICLEHLFSHMLVYTPWRRRKNALGALCARRRCAVTILCTPRAHRESSVTTQSIAGQNSVGARWHAVGAPRKRHCRRGRAVTSSHTTRNVIAYPRRYSCICNMDDGLLYERFLGIDISTSLSLSLTLSIYIYVCVCVFKWQSYSKYIIVCIYFFTE